MAALELLADKVFFVILIVAVLDLVHVPVNYILIPDALPRVEWMVWGCSQCIVQAPYCVWDIRRQRTPYITLCLRHSIWLR